MKVFLILLLVVMDGGCTPAKKRTPGTIQKPPDITAVSSPQETGEKQRAKILARIATKKRTCLTIFNTLAKCEKNPQTRRDSFLRACLQTFDHPGARTFFRCTTTLTTCVDIERCLKKDKGFSRYMK